MPSKFARIFVIKNFAIILPSQPLLGRHLGFTTFSCYILLHLPYLFNSLAFFAQILNDVHLVPSVVLRGNELLTKAPMDIDARKMQEENILTTCQTPVSVCALIRWLHIQGCRSVMDFFLFHLLFKHALCSLS